MRWRLRALTLVGALVGRGQRPFDHDHLETEVGEEEDEEREGEGGRVDRLRPPEEQHQPDHHEQPGEEPAGQGGHGRLHSVTQRPAGHDVADAEVHEAEAGADGRTPGPVPVGLDEGQRRHHEQADEGARP